MKRLLPLALFLGFAASALPALAEEVKVLLDLPAPNTSDLQWFPGGRYLLVSHWADDNSIHSVVVDVDQKRWKPVRWVQNRNDLGPPPWTCIRLYCNLVVSASGTGVKVEDLFTDPACKNWISDVRMANRFVPGDMLYDAAWPANIAVSPSGHYAMMRLQTVGEEGYEYEGFWIIRFDLGTLEEWEAWDKALAEQRRTPLVWELPEDRAVFTATWLYDPSGGPDRIAIVHGDPRETERGVSMRLLVLEITP